MIGRIHAKKSLIKKRRATDLKTAWFIDDDEEMIRAIKLMLELLDFKTLSFLTAKLAAKSLMDGQQPDVLLLDINMPNVSGIDMLEFVRRRTEWDHIPIVMLSSEFTDAQVDEAMALGADEYVFKPVMIDELEKAIRAAIEKRK